MDLEVHVIISIQEATRAATDADQALRAMRRVDRVDLLLTHVVMPGAADRRLAEQPQQRQPDLKVLLMTGYSRNAIVPQGGSTQASISPKSP